MPRSPSLPRLAGAAPALAVLLSLALMYGPLLTLQAVPVSDDLFTSDLLDAEFPARVAIGRALAAGQSPTWSDGLFSGYPLLAASSPEPVGLALFTLLPPAAALDLYLLLALAVAGLGTASLVRGLGGTPAGAALAGVAFAHSGFVVCQLRHLCELSTAVLLPVGLALLERARRAAGEGSARGALQALALFGLVFGEQVLCAFPQTAYAAALAYGAWMLVRLGTVDRPRRERLQLLGAGAGAGLLGTAVGAAALLPLLELGSTSDRAAGVSAEYASRLAYWVPHALSLLWPSPFGDVADRSFTGRGIFWEDYGYLGVLVVPLALLALARVRKAPVVGLLWGQALLAFALVLGPATPLFGLAFRFLPGMSTFRFPQRFLFITELALAVLAGLALGFLQAWLEERRAAGRPRFPAWVLPAALAAVGSLDVMTANARQNTLDHAQGWVEPPPAAQRVAREGGRVLTPGWKLLHQAAFQRAGGWAGDLAPLKGLRAFVPPDVGLLWDIPTADGYAGVAPRWSVDLWGDHNRRGLVTAAWTVSPEGAFTARPAFARLLAMNDVRFVLSPSTLRVPGLEEVGVEGPVHLHEVQGRLPRARVVPRAWVAPDEAAAAARLVAQDFDPRAEVVLAPGQAPAEAGEGGTGTAEVVSRDTTGAAVRVTASAPAWLVLAETWYPGWRALVDGVEVPVRRANLAQRAVPVPAGSHEVRFEYRAEATRRGVAVSLAAAGLLALLAIALRPRRGVPAA